MTLLPSSSAQGQANFRPGPYRTMEQLAASLKVSGASAEETQTLLALAKPSIALQSRAMADDAIPIGASKIGGAPDAPAGFVWPLRQPTIHGQTAAADLRARDVDGQNEHLWREIALKEILAKRIAPLAFMMQVDLAACAAMGPLDADMPRTGHFLVFYDLVFNPERGQEADGTPLFQLVYVDDKKLVRQQPPDLGYPLFGGIEAYRNRLPSARLMPIFTYTLPDQRAAPLTRSYLNRPYPHESWSNLRPTHLNASNRLGGWPENLKREMTIDLAARMPGSISHR